MSSLTTTGPESSPELGSPSTITQYHKKTGRPIRRSAGRVQPAAGYVDSKVIDEEDDEPIALPSEDDDGEPIKVSYLLAQTASQSRRIALFETDTPLNHFADSETPYFRLSENANASGHEHLRLHPHL
jgi:hypothetical protein